MVDDWTWESISSQCHALMGMPGFVEWWGLRGDWFSRAFRDHISDTLATRPEYRRWTNENLRGDWFNEEGTRYNQYDGVRQTYDGRVSMATDMMVWNVRRDHIIERMAVSTDEAWDVPGPNPPSRPDNTVPSQITDFTLKGRFDTTEAEKTTRDAYNKKYGLDQ